MSDFKVGDQIFFIYADAEYEDVSPCELTLVDGLIREIRIGSTYTLFALIESRTIEEKNCYKSKQDCIDAFIKRLGEL
jgi:hypothetical protein